ncbi:MAG: carboxypeptidase-like regulatory domain-containing protein [Bacteroides sp.]|nr:carboxypeptidase-like regulatory domain-containing protein [Bacteroides sp.]
MKFWIALIFILIMLPFRAAAENPERHLTLEEVTVKKGKKEKYTKKGNPAVAFIEKVMANRNLTDPKKTNPYYSYGQYERIKLGLLDFPIDSTGSLGFLAQYLDESPLSGGKVLNLTVKEKVSDVYFRREPETEREVVRVRNRHGLDDVVADASSMQEFANDILRPIDLYDTDDITILHTKYVSPLGRVATDFYKFYLSDTIADAERGDSLIVVSFLPHNPSVPGFNGRLYVVKGDSLTFIRRAELRLPKAANINYVKDMQIFQEYDRAPDGSRLKTKDELLIELGLLGKRAFASRLNVFNSHNFAAPHDSALFDDPRPVIEPTVTDEKIVNYRPADSQYGEANMDQMMSDLDKKKWIRYSLKVLRTLVDDQIKLGGRNAKLTYGPIFSTVSRNDLEGWRFRGGLNTTGALSHHWFAKAYGAYGLKDHRWKYGGELEYSFNRKEKHQMEFPIRSVKLSYSDDVDKLGQSYSATDAFFTSLSFTKNKLLTYKKMAAVDFNWETYSRWAFNLQLSYQQQNPSRYVEFTDGYGQTFDRLAMGLAKFEVRWAPQEKYYQSSKSRRSISFYGPVIRLTHTLGPKGLFGARYWTNKTEAGIEQRFWLSAWGHIDLTVTGGHVWSKSDFFSLTTPEANISFFFNKKNFMLMKPLEFINDSYAALHMEYQARGALFNYIPLLKKLKLREVLGFHSIWGHLSNKNNPALHPELLNFPAGASPVKMNGMPYMEFNVGIENILTFLRVDYVRRLTYLGSPGVQKNGVRVSLHITF